MKKQMNFLILILVTVFIGTIAISCHSTSKILPTQKEPPKVQPSPTPTPVQSASLDLVRTLAVASSCGKYSFANQGYALKSFLKGIALSYAKALCHPNTDSVVVASQVVGAASVDALALYSDILIKNKMSVATSKERLRHVYALMVGSSARESSWVWCNGKDPGADNTSGETCEAGLYQTSYDSRSANSVLVPLYNQFKASDVGCFASDYKGTITCKASQLKNWGSGEGVTFQALTKSCPGFATEYHAVMLRTKRTHYGPINSKADELRPECDQMFQDIETLVQNNPGLCLNL